MSEDNDIKPAFPEPPDTTETPEEKPELANINNDIEKPADMKWADYLRHPDKPLNARHKKLAFMLAHGAKSKEIAAKLHYNFHTVNMLRSSQAIKKEVARVQERMFEESLDDRIKTLGPDAMDVIEQHINNDDLSTIKREATAKWLIEKVTGKPAQSIDVKGDISVGIFLDQLDQMRESGQVLDVTPNKAKLEENEEATPQEDVKVDPLGDWVDKNF